MSTFRNPVGPQPSRIYWRRRAVVLLGLVAVIVVIILIVVRPGSDGKPPAVKPSSTSSTTPTATPTAGAVACDPTKVVVTPVTDAATYDPGVNPLLTFAIKSTDTKPCTFQAGSDVQEYKITSGDELIWTSKDCQSNEVAATTTLLPGVPQSPASIAWDRTRSSADTCASAREQVIAGGASYHLSVTVGGITSADTKQFILN